MHYPFPFYALLLADIASWQDKQFPEGTQSGALNHLKKECKELERNPDDIEEWADALFMVIQGGRKAAGGSLEHFMQEVNYKLLKNMSRQWGEMAPDGTVEHVRE